MNRFSYDQLFAAARAADKVLAQGEFLFHKGDIATHIYTVMEGRVRMVRFSREGVAVVMHTARAGDSLAEASLFSEVYHCDAEATLPSTLACYDKKRIMAGLRQSPEKSLAGLALFARQVRELRALLEVRSVRSAPDRVLHYLLLLADPETMTVDLVGTVKEMATDLALAHETLYRTLAALEKEGKIKRGEGFIKLMGRWIA